MTPRRISVWMVAFLAASLVGGGLRAQMPPGPPPPPSAPAAENAAAPEPSTPAAVVRLPDEEPEAATPEAEASPPHRDPFWPPGYAPAKPKPTKVAAANKPAPVVIPEWDAARKTLEIRGISRLGQSKEGGERYLAIVNGKVVEEGETVSVVWEGRQYRWKVLAIGPKGVSLTKLDVRVP
jgi:hypothetical protein